MKFGTIDKVILFGGSCLLMHSCLWLQEERIFVVVFTSPRHLADRVGERGETLKEFLEKKHVKYFSSLDINSDRRITRYITPTTLGIAMGPAWIFKKKIVQRFDGKLLNFMGIKLPQYRGGAHYTWQILRRDKTGACHLQLINEHLDGGGVVKSKRYRLPSSARIPKDYFDCATKQEIAFLKVFFRALGKNKTFKVSKVNEAKSLYLPYLSSKEQGYINWSWSVKEIESFICAFDDPYPGASTFIDGQRVSIKKCFFTKNDGTFHPFANGLIYRVEKDAIFVAVSDGSLKIEEVLDRAGRNTLASLKAGRRFYTPQAYLDRAMTFRAVYTAGGLKNGVDRTDRKVS